MGQSPVRTRHNPIYSPGYICRTAGLQEPTERCNDGFYCERGAEVEGDQTECPVGHYCVDGERVVLSLPL